MTLADEDTFSKLVEVFLLFFDVSVVDIVDDQLELFGPRLDLALLRFIVAV